MTPPAALLRGTLSASIWLQREPTPCAYDQCAATSAPVHPANHTPALHPAIQCAVRRSAQRTPTAATPNGTRTASTSLAPLLHADAVTCAAMSAPAIAAALMTAVRATMQRAAPRSVRKMHIAATPCGTASAQVLLAIPAPPRMRRAQFRRAEVISSRVAACPARCQTAPTRVAATACAWSTRSAVTRPGTSPV